VRKLALALLAGCAVGASFGALTFVHPADGGLSPERLIILAFPALVSALIFVAWLSSRRALDRAQGTVSELNAQLIRKEIELDHLASVDELTGLLTRRPFEEHVRLEFERTRRHHRPVALLLLEIDDLQALGQRVGRLGRGYLVSQVGDIVRARCRVNDVAGRYTPDVLALLLPDSSEAQALSVADKIRGEVQVNSFMGEPYEAPLRLTLSIGIAVSPHDDIRAPEHLQRAAEEALYAAKAAGFDALSVHGAASPVRAAPRPGDLPLAS
jgi:diguanylate cyclase (GGDEF)-like protein